MHDPYFRRLTEWHGASLLVSSVFTLSDINASLLVPYMQIILFTIFIFAWITYIFLILTKTFFTTTEAFIEAFTIWIWLEAYIGSSNPFSLYMYAYLFIIYHLLHGPHVF